MNNTTITITAAMLLIAAVLGLHESAGAQGGSANAKRQTPRVTFRLQPLRAHF